MFKTKLKKVYFILALAGIILSSGVIGFFAGRIFYLNPDYNKIGVDLQAINQGQGDIFSKVVGSLKTGFLGSVDAKKSYYGAIKGYVASLGDPYTVFFDPEESKTFKSELAGELEGIGVKMVEDGDYPVVVAPLSGTPAAQAGIKPKDKIVEIDGKSTQGKTLDEVTSWIRGVSGTKVKVVVIRSGDEQPIEFEITRMLIKVQSVEGKQIGDTGYILLSEFGPDTAELFHNQAQKLKDAGVSKFVIDLRNNPGGLLDQAILVANDIFSRDTPVVIEQDKSKKNDETKTTQDGLLKQDKIIVLVNDGTASAAEILAGAVQDDNRGKIIGEKTYGKGTVQQYEEFDDRSSLKVTIAKWLTPKGHDIDKEGISPDIEVKLNRAPGEDESDPVISRAISELGRN
ncbi:S41 family peptidase [Candidatus Berkelbacteria bacterium CG10_big_fil_rev_8_21_14_0_10_41_12]|uniref:S41 family peptidase n=1 Tax=Candidatus Berkelbacteria bacterium CG10_big_fil_rev_8_21_14_0_10_41_12 TaxID=1974513 RepID=A0A2M6WWC9_9BACT|nr:MAG: S41 family peptidase [Candidatus Berkelbacteria bacterium CG10_big_fil_rev_8_21_14_0_10_41_12]